MNASVSQIRREKYDPYCMPEPMLYEALAPLGIKIERGDPETISLRVLQLHRYALTHFAASGDIAISTDRPNGGRNRYLFVFVARGTLRAGASAMSTIASGECLSVASPGETTCRIESDEPSDFITFSFDVGEVAPLELMPGSVVKIGADSSLFRAIYSLLRASVDSDATHEPPNEPAIRMLLMGAARGLMASSQPARVPLHQAAMALIWAQHTNPDLDATFIAEELTVSLSSLYRAFAGRPRSLATEIQLARLRTALSHLSVDPELTQKELARLSGFTSVLSFQRARSAHAETPLYPSASGPAPNR